MTRFEFELKLQMKAIHLYAVTHFMSDDVAAMAWIEKGWAKMWGDAQAVVNNALDRITIA